MSKFYSALMLARHVSDLIDPSSGAFCTSCICRLWYVVLTGRYDLMYMKTKELGWKENRGIQNIGIEDS